MKSEQEKDKEAYADYERKCTGWVTIVVIAIMIMLYFAIFH